MNFEKKYALGERKLSLSLMNIGSSLIISRAEFDVPNHRALMVRINITEVAYLRGLWVPLTIALKLSCGKTINTIATMTGACAEQDYKVGPVIEHDIHISCRQKKKLTKPCCKVHPGSGGSSRGYSGIDRGSTSAAVCRNDSDC